MELLNLSVKDYLDELSKKVSTPGGGSALAIVLSPEFYSCYAIK